MLVGPYQQYSVLGASRMAARSKYGSVISRPGPITTAPITTAPIGTPDSAATVTAASAHAGPAIPVSHRAVGSR